MCDRNLKGNMLHYQYEVSIYRALLFEMHIGFQLCVGIRRWYAHWSIMIVSGCIVVVFLRIAEIQYALYVPLCIPMPAASRCKIVFHHVSLWVLVISCISLSTSIETFSDWSSVSVNHKRCCWNRSCQMMWPNGFWFASSKTARQKHNQLF